MVSHIVYTRNIMCPITECSSTVFIWTDDGSMSRNMSPNFNISYEHVLCLLTE